MSILQVEPLPKTAHIYIAGHKGLVGSALLKHLKNKGFQNLSYFDSKELDLKRQKDVEECFEKIRPEYLFIAAAKVGGIIANSSYPADFIYQNLMIEANLIDAAYRSGVKRLIFLGSSCIYPKFSPQPMREEYLLTGALEPTNQPYAIAKIAGIELIRSYNAQYGTKSLAVMPTNLYGPNDNFDLNNSHVLPAMIRKMDSAKREGKAQLTLFGTGKPRREFLYSEDLAEALVFLMSLSDEKFEKLISQDFYPLVNVGVGEDLTINELCSIVKEVVGFNGEILWDTTKPDGTPRKLLDISKMKALGWSPKMKLREGIALSYEAYRCALR